jgi:fatty acid desaturase
VTSATACLYVIVITIIASRQRALECLIHEATHVNLSPNVKINDALAWIFAALPLGHNVKTERFSHLIGHHKNFWDTDLDPDYRRYRLTGVDQLPTSSYTKLLQILTKGFIPYIKSTVPTFFLPKGEDQRIRLLRLGFWAVVIISSSLTGLLIPLLLYWVVPFLTILILVRYIGEASEHAALGCTDELSTTRNNLGWLNEHFIHPRGDAYHLVHHLYPKVPYHEIAKVHSLLMKDPVYKNIGHHSTGFVIKVTEQKTTIQWLMNR